MKNRNKFNSKQPTIQTYYYPNNLFLHKKSNHSKNFFKKIPSQHIQYSKINTCISKNQQSDSQLIKSSYILSKRAIESSKKFTKKQQNHLLTQHYSKTQSLSEYLRLIKKSTNISLKKDNQTDDQKLKKSVAIQRLNRILRQKRYAENPDYVFSIYKKKMEQKQISKQICRLLNLYQILEDLGIKKNKLTALIQKYCEQKEDLRKIVLYRKHKNLLNDKVIFMYSNDPNQIFKKVQQHFFIHYQEFDKKIQEFLDFINKVETWIIQHHQKQIEEINKGCLKQNKQYSNNFMNEQRQTNNNEDFVFSVNQKIKTIEDKYGQFKNLSKHNTIFFKQLNSLQRNIIRRQQKYNVKMKNVENLLPLLIQQ